METSNHAPPGAPILFYDGVCGLCHRAVRFILRHDRGGRFRFAALQSGFAQAVLPRHGADPRDLDTMYLLADYRRPSERLLRKADAVIAVLEAVGGPWKLAAVLRALPRSLRDGGYDLVARRRYRWFGRYDQCPLPPLEVRGRFLDGGETGAPALASMG